MRFKLNADGRSPRWVTRLLGVIGKRPLDRVGQGTIFAGSLYAVNDGTIEIGENCYISSHPVRSHLLAMPGAALMIGDRVVISYGAGLSAFAGITIGDDTRIGPFCLVMDSDQHLVDDRDSPGLKAPVYIGRNVTIGARVTVLRGAHIGDGARVMSGSTVFGVVREGSVVSGIPARPVKEDSHVRIDPRIPLLIKRLFGLSSLPNPLFKLGELRDWTTLGWVRLLLALEEIFAITLPEGEMREAVDVSQVSRLVMQTCAHRAPTLRGNSPPRGISKIHAV
jgi:acetyltransferase-like isoleucine patch superfamily enzyme